jgi:S-adenosylmethionine:tRNA-ribosyltransferase-isomerase (queuine synthetase)
MRAVRASDFDFDLPADLIAQFPLPDRTASRLLVVDGQTAMNSANGSVRVICWFSTIPA